MCTMLSTMNDMTSTSVFGKKGREDVLYVFGFCCRFSDDGIEILALRMLCNVEIVP